MHGFGGVRLSSEKLSDSKTITGSRVANARHAARGTYAWFSKFILVLGEEHIAEYHEGTTLVSTTVLFRSVSLHLPGIANPCAVTDLAVTTIHAATIALCIRHGLLLPRVLESRRRVHIRITFFDIPFETSTPRLRSAKATREIVESNRSSGEELRSCSQST